MKIPNSFKIAGGKEIKVNLVDSLNGDYGNWNDAEGSINLSKTVIIDNTIYPISDEDIERTFWHEFVHCMNWFYNCEADEALAQTFSNFLYEFSQTKK